MSFLDDLLNVFKTGSADSGSSPDSSSPDASSAPAPDQGQDPQAAPAGDAGGALATMFSGAQAPGNVNPAEMPGSGGSGNPGYSGGDQHSTGSADNSPETPGVLTKLMQGFGIAGHDGSIDYSNPKVMDQLMRGILGGGNALNTLLSGGKARGYKTATQMRDELAGPYNNWNPQQSASANAYFGGGVQPAHGLAPSANMTSPIVPGQQAPRRYAEGGSTSAPEVMDDHPTFHSQGALASLVKGNGGGQDDLVPARLSPGEYVFDADTTSALGDGDNKRGAEILDKFREEIRAHKRSAPPSSIPPKSRTPMHYLGKVKA